MASDWSGIRLVTLDLDDTLVATTATVPARVRAASARAAGLLGRSFTSTEVDDLVAAALTRDPDLRWDVLLASLGVSRNHPHAEALIDAYTAPMLDLLEATPGACETVAALVERFRVIVITNGSDPLQRTKLHRCGMGMLASTAVVSEPFGTGKPDPRIFHHACAQAGISPEHAVHVGDSPCNDAQGAIRAGMRAILIRTAVPHRPSDVPPHATIDALGELMPLLGLSRLQHIRSPSPSQPGACATGRGGGRGAGG